MEQRLREAAGDSVKCLRLVLCIIYLVNEWSSVGVALQQHTGPQLRVFAADQVARQALEEGVLIADLQRKQEIMEVKCSIKQGRSLKKTLRTQVRDRQAQKCILTLISS